jgi:hypothetical protein
MVLLFSLNFLKLSIILKVNSWKNKGIWGEKSGYSGTMGRSGESLKHAEKYGEKKVVIVEQWGEA